MTKGKNEIGPNPIEEAIKKIEDQKRTNETNRLKREMAAFRSRNRDPERDAKRRALNTTDDKGNPYPLMEKALRQAEHVLNSEFNSTYNWLSAMVNLLNMFTVLNKALAAWVDADIAQPAKEIIIDQIFLGLIKDNIMIKAPKETLLSAMDYKIGYSDDEGLKIAPLFAPRQDALSQLYKDANQVFARGVRLWLKEEGYLKNRGDNKYHHKDDVNKVLTAEQFADIKDRFKDYIARTEPNLTLNELPEEDPEPPATFKP